MSQDNKGKLINDIEKILKKKGEGIRAATSEELVQKMVGRLEKELPRIVRKLQYAVVEEELARLGRSQPCRYFRKQSCTKGILICSMDCGAYRPLPWWRQRPGIKLFYTLEGWVIGLCTLTFITALPSAGELLPLLCGYFAIIIISIILVCYQMRFIRELTGV